jgi:hypothetical protein
LGTNAGSKLERVSVAFDPFYDSRPLAQQGFMRYAETGNVTSQFTDKKARFDHDSDQLPRIVVAKHA